MKTTKLGMLDLIIRNNRLFLLTEESQEAAVQAEWADNVLAREDHIFGNGRSSHEAAGEVLEESEETLLKYLVTV